MQAFDIDDILLSAHVDTGSEGDRLLICLCELLGRTKLESISGYFTVFGNWMIKGYDVLTCTFEADGKQFQTEISVVSSSILC